MNTSSIGHLACAAKRAALVVAHPGHELRVHGWLEAVRPIVFVLTDGSGRSNQSRLGSTTVVLDRAKASAGSIYGYLTDQAAYAAILNHDFERFIALAGKLSGAFVREQIDFVAGDAIEGYNPMHDVCRLIIDEALTAAREVDGRDIPNLAFSLVEQTHVTLGSPDANELWLELDDAALERKITAAQGYPELTGEVSEALATAGIDAFRVERMRVVDADADARFLAQKPPFYEQHGERQVAAGHYERVLRYSEHIAPLAEALAVWSKASPSALGRRAGMRG